MHIHQSESSAARSLSRPDLKPVILRAAIVAALLGPVLNLANQWGAIRAGTIDALAAVLFFSTPFLTVFISQLVAYRAVARVLADNTAQIGLVALTLRATAIGTILAMLNISLLVGVAAVAGSEPPSFPIALAVQSLLLPTLFSAASQYLTHRRLLGRRASPSR